LSKSLARFSRKARSSKLSRRIQQESNHNDQNNTPLSAQTGMAAAMPDCRQRVNVAELGLIELL
jgi:hypothetical protein